jgi:hypothetical protein
VKPTLRIPQSNEPRQENLFFLTQRRRITINLANMAAKPTILNSIQRSFSRTIKRPQAMIGLFLFLAAVAIAGPTGPNVLFIISDDLRPDLSCYGSYVETPNLDRLAGRGVRFANTWAQYPLCNPSRTSMLTGRHPTTTGALMNRNYFRDSYPDMVTLPQLFRIAGYDSLRIGKVFHDSADDPISWTYGAKRAVGAPIPTPTYTMDMHRTNSDRIIILEGDGEKHPDYKVAADVISKLREYATNQRPFFMTCGFSKPHSPPTAPKNGSIPSRSVQLLCQWISNQKPIPPLSFRWLHFRPAAICSSSAKPAKQRPKR